MTNQKLGLGITRLALAALFLIFSSGAFASDTYKVYRVTDGDTLKLSNGDVVRLIGVDTPESFDNRKLYRDAKNTGQSKEVIKTLGRKAARFSKDLLEGKDIRLEFDVQQRDRYGRLLAYVYLEDGTHVNAEIVKEGFAQVMTVPPNVKYQDLFLELETEAREGGKGLWAIQIRGEMVGKAV